MSIGAAVWSHNSAWRHRSCIVCKGSSRDLPRFGNPTTFVVLQLTETPNLQAIQLTELFDDGALVGLACDMRFGIGKKNLEREG